MRKPKAHNCLSALNEKDNLGVQSLRIQIKPVYSTSLKRVVATILYPPKPKNTITTPVEPLIVPAFVITLYFVIEGSL